MEKKWGTKTLLICFEAFNEVYIHIENKNIIFLMELDQDYLSIVSSMTRLPPKPPKLND